MNFLAQFLHLSCFVFLFWIGPVQAQSLTPQSRIAFYYGDQWPIPEFHAFHVTVVNPKDRIKPKEYNNAESELFAYVSIGETSTDASYFHKIKKDWHAGKNPAWNSIVMDMSNQQWQNFLLNQIIEPLWSEGYRGFFFDTLDSYHLTQLPALAQEQGIIRIIKEFKKKHPEGQLILNRGFEIIPQVHPLVGAVAAESLYSEWDPVGKKYHAVDDKKRTWLQTKLLELKKQYSLPIIIIDYLPVHDKTKARQIAQTIQSQGFIPWIGNKDLSNIGTGTIEIVPRRIAILYSRNYSVDPLTNVAYQPVSFPLQYMGYLPEFYAVSEELPSTLVQGAYAGIITLFNEPVLKNHQQVSQFFMHQKMNKLPIVQMGYLGLPENSPFLRQQGIKISEIQGTVQSLKLIKKSPIIHYEITIQPNILDFFPLSLADGDILAKSRASNGQEQVIAAITPSGGFVLNPYYLAQLPDGQNRWVINPLEFFKRALRLPEMPTPDLTTSNGRRMFMAQIDGDSFISKVAWREDEYAGKVMLEEILNTYHLPITVSFIQREFELLDPHPELLDRTIKTAKKILSLPWIQAASHTYSHPLVWEKLIPGEENTSYLSYPSPQYHFSYQKEILGSTEFINTYLSPKGKKAEIILWSGDSVINSEALKYASQSNLLNINGMGALYLEGSQSLTNLSALGQWVGSYYHVFSPLGNDFNYTSNWSLPLYKFNNLIQTLELTEKPYRYKPISVYYHFYSALDQGALEALKQIYQWVLQQEITPISLKDYIQKVLAFNQIVIAKTLQGDWLITNNGPIRELRSPMGLGYPQPSIAHNILGFTQTNGQFYIHLGLEPLSQLSYSPKKPTQPYLDNANADEIAWSRMSENNYVLNFKGQVPFAFELAQAEECSVFYKNKKISASETMRYLIKDDPIGTLTIYCSKRS